MSMSEKIINASIRIIFILWTIDFHYKKRLLSLFDENNFEIDFTNSLFTWALIVWLGSWQFYSENSLF